MDPSRPRYRTVLVAVIAVAATIAMQPAAAQRTSHAAASDSVSVLLFAGSSASMLVVDGRGLAIDGDDAGRAERLRPRADGERVTLDGIRRASLTITAAHDLTVELGSRRRRFAGSLRLRAVGGRLVAVARMARREYLAGVLAAEAHARDPREYLVALAVLQSNYLDAHRERHAPDADVCDNTHCQIYHGDGVASALRSVVEDAATMELRAGAALPCYYSANCGGSTLTPERVWGRPEPGYTAVACDNCRNARWFRWTRQFAATSTAVAIVATAPPAPFIDDDFKIRAGRALGFGMVPSNSIDRIERRGGRFSISGRGFGHRVGLCQDGARTLAQRGRSAAEILAHYFPAATLVERAAHN